MAKFQLSDIKAGSLVSEVRYETVDFWHNGEECSVDISIKQLPFVETQSLHSRMDENEEGVIAEWISKALVDEKGKVQFTKKQVEDNFVQPLAVAVFNKVWGIDSVKKAMEQLKAKTEKE